MRAVSQECSADRKEKPTEVVAAVLGPPVINVSLGPVLFYVVLRFLLNPQSGNGLPECVHCIQSVFGRKSRPLSVMNMRRNFVHSLIKNLAKRSDYRRASSRRRSVLHCYK